MNTDPFMEYIKQSEPNKRDKGYAWHIAIGLQAVDGLKPSKYLIETAIKNIEGDISIDEAQELLNAYYEANPKRNSARFPEDFMFQLTKTEIPEEFSKSQIATLNENGDRRGTNIKKLPFAFTEQGIYMLATVLRGELAEQQSIFIMRAFREMRHYIKQNQQFVTQSEMRLVTAKVSEISVQVAGISDWKKKTESDIVSKMWKLFCLQRMVMVA